MEEALQKLNSENENGYRDTARWRTASFRETFASTSTSTSASESQYKYLDSLFENGVVWKVFKHFLKLDCTSRDEANLLSLIPFDAIFTDAVKYVVHDLRLTAENHAQRFGSWYIRKDEILKSNCAHNRGSPIPQKWERIAKALIPIAAANHLYSGYKTFCFVQIVQQQIQKPVWIPAFSLRDMVKRKRKRGREKTRFVSECLKTDSTISLYGYTRSKTTYVTGWVLLMNAIVYTVLSLKEGLMPF